MNKYWIALTTITLLSVSNLLLAEWPQYYGPRWDMTAESKIPVYGDTPPLLWESEALIPSGRSADGRRAGAEETLQESHSGGYSSPIVADGNIFLYTYIRSAGNGNRL